MALIGFASTVGGCHHYRAELPARAVAAAGARVALGADLAIEPNGGPIGMTTRDLDERDMVAVDEETNEPRAVIMLDDGWVEPETIVLAGGYPAALGGDIVARAVAAGQRVICDCDDYPSLPASNPHYHPAAYGSKMSAFRAASAVTCATPGLQRFLAKEGIEATLARNWIDRARWTDVRLHNVARRLQRRRGALLVGYRGMLAGFHDADVRTLRGQLPYDDLVHIGADPRAAQGFASLTHIPPRRVLERQAVEFEHYGAQLAGIDAAVIPYADRAFSSHKSNIAAMEWTAAGVPWLSYGNPEVRALDPTRCVADPHLRGSIAKQLAAWRDPGEAARVVSEQWALLDCWLDEVATVDPWLELLDLAPQHA